MSSPTVDELLEQLENAIDVSTNQVELVSALGRLEALRAGARLYELAARRIESGDELLDMKQAAELLGIKESLARELGRKGQLPTVTVGRLVRVRRSALAQWLRDHEKGARP